MFSLIKWDFLFLNKTGLIKCISKIGPKILALIAYRSKDPIKWDKKPMFYVWLDMYMTRMLWLCEMQIRLSVNECYVREWMKWEILDLETAKSLR